MVRKSEIVVVGNGVIGMTTALCLRKAGCERVVVVSKDPPAQTTSAVAAAFWYPFKAEPMEKVAGWGQVSLAVFRSQQNIAEAGIVWHKFSEFLLPGSPLPWWHEVVDDFERDDSVTEQAFGRREVCYYRVPTIDTSMYLPYLEQCLRSQNVEFITADLTDINQAFSYAPLVVNCSGIGAIQLAGDCDLHPVRGQIVRIKKNESHRAVLDVTREPKLAHVTPRVSDTVLGGTYESDQLSLEPNETVTREIIERCKSILPELSYLTESDVLAVACGLRPVRSSVRVEKEQTEHGWLFHNYGHGGAGFTLSWGCAEEMVALIEGCSLN